MRRKPTGLNFKHQAKNRRLKEQDSYPWRKAFSDISYLPKKFYRDFNGVVKVIIIVGLINMFVSLALRLFNISPVGILVLKGTFPYVEQPRYVTLLGFLLALSSVIGVVIIFTRYYRKERYTLRTIPLFKVLIAAMLLATLGAYINSASPWATWFLMPFKFLDSAGGFWGKELSWLPQVPYWFLLIVASLMFVRYIVDNITLRSIVLFVIANTLAAWFWFPILWIITAASFIYLIVSLNNHTSRFLKFTFYIILTVITLAGAYGIVWLLSFDTIFKDVIYDTLYNVGLLPFAKKLILSFLFGFMPTSLMLWFIIRNVPQILFFIDKKRDNLAYRWLVVIKKAISRYSVLFVGVPLVFIYLFILTQAFSFLLFNKEQLITRYGFSSFSQFAIRGMQELVVTLIAVVLAGVVLYSTFFDKKRAVLNRVLFLALGVALFAMTIFTIIKLRFYIQTYGYTLKRVMAIIGLVFMLITIPYVFIDTIRDITKKRYFEKFIFINGFSLRLVLVGTVLITLYALLPLNTITARLAANATLQNKQSILYLYKPEIFYGSTVVIKTLNENNNMHPLYSLLAKHMFLSRYIDEFLEYKMRQEHKNTLEQIVTFNPALNSILRYYGMLVADKEPLDVKEKVAADIIKMSAKEIGQYIDGYTVYHAAMRLKCYYSGGYGLSLPPFIAPSYGGLEADYAPQRPIIAANLSDVYAKYNVSIEKLLYKLQSEGLKEFVYCESFLLQPLDKLPRGFSLGIYFLPAHTLDDVNVILILYR